MPGIDERRLELIDGEVYEKPGRRWGHGVLVGELGAVLNQYGESGSSPRAIIPAAGNWGASSPLPDLAFYRNNPPAAHEWMTQPPHVAVEVVFLDQSRLETRAKVDLYLSFGVESVWVVDLERGEIDLYEHGERRTLSGDDTLESSAVPGLRIPVSELLRRPE